jgi:pyrroline-5-carboxylate reductase
MVLAGAGESSQMSSLGLSELIQNVTSKGGVTIAVLEHWRAHQLGKLIESGAAAGKARSSEIKKLLS